VIYIRTTEAKLEKGHRNTIGSKGSSLQQAAQKLSKLFQPATAA
jgi:hypothetical protein